MESFDLRSYKSKGNSFVVFELKKNELEIVNELLSIPESKKFDVNSVSGGDLIQIIIPLASVLLTTSGILIKKIFDTQKVEIKVFGKEISVFGYEKALKLLKEIYELDMRFNKEAIEKHRKH